jgi:endonuclease/exonuclease/phosphatase family metal-dependent hydrolase
MVTIVGLVLVHQPCSGQDDDHIRVVSYNIRLDTPDDGTNAWTHRKDRVAGLLQYHQADIIGLQEALRHQIAYLKEELEDFDWYGVGREDGLSKGEFVPIFYRADRFERLRIGTFWLSESPDSVGSVGWDAALPRIATWVLLRDRSTDSITLFVNTHFDHIGEEARLESARLLREQVGYLAKQVPVVVMGDFNATPESPPYEALTAVEPAAGPILIDLDRVSATDHYGPHETWSSFSVGSEDVARIDYIFGSPGIRVRRSAVLSDQWHGTYPSDHLPVLVEIRSSLEARSGR